LPAAISAFIRSKVSVAMLASQFIWIAARQSEAA